MKSLALALLLFSQVQAPLDADDTAVPLPPVEKSVLVEPTPKGNHTKRGVLPDDLPDGIYTLKVVGGVKTLETAEEIPLNGPPGPGPTPVPPVPNVLTDFGKAIKAAADKATADPKRSETAAGLAAFYKEWATNAKAPATLETLSNTTLKGTDLALAFSNVTEAWKPMRDVLRAQIVDLIQRGRPVEEFGAMLRDAAAGLEASAPPPKTGTVYKTPSGVPISGISPEFWAFLMELLKMLLPYLLPK